MRLTNSLARFKSSFKYSSSYIAHTRAAMREARLDGLGLFNVEKFPLQAMAVHHNQDSDPGFGRASLRNVNRY